MDISFSLGNVWAKLNLKREEAGGALATTECREHSAEHRASGEAAYRTLTSVERFGEDPPAGGRALVNRPSPEGERTLF